MPDATPKPSTRTVSFKKKDGTSVSFTSTGARKAARDAAKATTPKAAPKA